MSCAFAGCAPPNAAQAVVSPVAPVDLVGANRSRVEAGNLPLPLTEVWRHQFDGELHESLLALQDEAERSAGLNAVHLDAVRLSVAPKGVRASALGPAQQELLRALLAVYFGRIPDDVAADEAAKYETKHIAELSFAWAGGTESGQAHYYRVQGPHLLIEYDNTQRNANHVHSVWRDPSGDFGEDDLRLHHLQSHMAH